MEKKSREQAVQREFFTCCPSLESCCIIAFNIAGDVAESSQRLLSQMWVLTKAILDRSLSLIKRSITNYQETMPHGKKESRRTSHMVLWGARGGAGEEEEP